MRKVLKTVFLAAMLVLFCMSQMTIQIDAVEKPTGDLKITGGTYGKDYRYDNHVVSVLTDTPLIISGESKKDRILIKNGTNAVITLKNVKITVSDCAFQAGDDKTEIKLVGNNYLKSGMSYPGIQVPEKAEVTISGSNKDSLLVFGGSHSAGIGSKKDEAFGTVVLTGGTITASGGMKAAGIGNGNQGYGGTVRFEGGLIRANGGAGAADIGSPQAIGQSGRILLDGDCVLYADKAEDLIECKRGIMVSGNKMEVYQQVQLSYPLLIGMDQTMFIPQEGGLTISEEAECTNRGTIYVYGQMDVEGTLVNEGEILDFSMQLSSESGITGNSVIEQDVHEIFLSNGSVQFTEDGYKQGGMAVPVSDMESRFTINGDNQKTVGMIQVDDDVRINCILNNVNLTSRDTEYAMILGKGGQMNLTLQGDSVFTSDSNALAGSISVGEKSELNLSGSGSLTLQGLNGGKIVLQGDGTVPEDMDGMETLSDENQEAEGMTRIKMTEDAKKLEVRAERSDLERMVEERGELTIDGKMIQMSLDWRAVDELLDGTDGDVIIRVTPFVLGDTFAAAKVYVSDRPVYDIQVVDVLNPDTISSEQIRNIQFTKGKAILSIPYEKKENEDIRNLYLLYVGTNNMLDWIQESTYDSQKKVITSELDHLSVYGVGYTVPSLTGAAAASQSSAVKPVK